VTTLGHPRPDVLEKDGCRIVREPDGRLMVTVTVGTIHLTPDDVRLLAQLANIRTEQDAHA
jgi:F0F1-type ATP synthase epsilon subunit